MSSAEGSSHFGTLRTSKTSITPKNGWMEELFAAVVFRVGFVRVSKGRRGAAFFQRHFMYRSFVYNLAKGIE